MGGARARLALALPDHQPSHTLSLTHSPLPHSPPPMSSSLSIYDSPAPPAVLEAVGSPLEAEVHSVRETSAAVLHQLSLHSQLVRNKLASFESSTLQSGTELVRQEPNLNQGGP